ncbi:MAG: transcription termination/antitermination protein NusA [Bacteroidaceae bacterium]|nr:transcription termination/antitermination protein NusA [Bacteroidaceae bacterium]
MATKKTETLSLLDNFKDFKENKKIDAATLVGVLEESFRSILAKMYGSDDNFDVIINPTNGDFEIYRTRVVVEDNEVNDPNREIPLSEAQQIASDYEVGEEVSEKYDPKNFGRRMLLTLRQTLAGKVTELEHDNIYNKYKDMIGQIVSPEIYQTWKNEVLLVDEDQNELLMLRQDMIPGDFFRKGDLVKCVVTRVEMVNNRPKVYVSRTSPDFLRRLLEEEVSEIADGLITVKDVARIPGERAKVSVESYDDRIDPVGACVGVKGRRILGIVRELHNENIDVINYTTNKTLYIERALSPAHISTVYLDEATQKAEVYLKPAEVSLAIGRNGLNIKLACMLTGYTIDVFRETDGEVEDDIYLDEFNDEIDQWVIDTIKNAGWKTAREVMAAQRADLLAKTDLEEDTIENVLRVLKEEFEQE